MEEEERLKAEIAETKERTKERKALAERADQIKKVSSETKQWMAQEMEQRREVISEQRKQSRQAIEARRLALLESRHGDFVLKKQETDLARTAILQARAAKQQQKQAQMMSVRERQARAKERNRQIGAEKNESQSAHTAILNVQKEAELKWSLRQIDELAKEEEKLLASVLSQHAEHRKEFDALKERTPAYSRGLTGAPGPFALPQPIAADSPLLARRPATSLDGSRTDTLSSVRLATTMGGAFGNSGRSCFSGQYSYGNSVPSTPRTGTSRPGTSSMLASPRSRSLSERPTSQGSQRVRVSGGCCSASMVQAASTRILPPTTHVPPMEAIPISPSKLPYA